MIETLVNLNKERINLCKLLRKNGVSEQDLIRAVEGYQKAELDALYCLSIKPRIRSRNENEFA